jgi:hypothetical protein
MVLYLSLSLEYHTSKVSLSLSLPYGWVCLFLFFLLALVYIKNHFIIPLKLHYWRILVSCKSFFFFAYGILLLLWKKKIIDFFGFLLFTVLCSSLCSWKVTNEIVFFFYILHHIRSIYSGICCILKMICFLYFV